MCLQCVKVWPVILCIDQHLPVTAIPIVQRLSSTSVVLSNMVLRDSVGAMGTLLTLLLVVLTHKAESIQTPSYPLPTMAINAGWIDPARAASATNYTGRNFGRNATRQCAMR